MPNIKTISDGGSNPNTPTIEEMRESQRASSVGKGTSTKTYAEKMARDNHGTGLGEGEDETFPEAGEYSAEGKLPWE